ncbi:hypothetical protein GGR56DRAFT_635749 [Xylariaceae sp. FL0804]|nr:hypothetical protein GGR56DRAFT_635749 [Xylariaceae sp. FL0804]
MQLTAVFPLVATVAASRRSMPLLVRQTNSGVATFNDYASQSTTVCGSFSGVSGTYGAAASDISPDISGGLCYASIDYSECDGQVPVSGYSGPSCPTTNCGTCYTVTNEGGYDGASASGTGNSITVQIIDSCPSVSAYNFCKTDVPDDERCESSTTNALDIDVSAYEALTGSAWTDTSPNLEINILPATCP